MQGRGKIHQDVQGPPDTHMHLLHKIKILHLTDLEKTLLVCHSSAQVLRILLHLVFPLLDPCDQIGNSSLRGSCWRQRSKIMLGAAAQFTPVCPFLASEGQASTRSPASSLCKLWSQFYRSSVCIFHILGQQHPPPSPFSIAWKFCRILTLDKQDKMEKFFN